MVLCYILEQEEIAQVALINLHTAIAHAQLAPQPNSLRKLGQAAKKAVTTCSSMYKKSLQQAEVNEEKELLRKVTILEELEERMDKAFK